MTLMEGQGLVERLPLPQAGPDFARLLGTWRSKQRGGALPRRSDFDPLELGSLLPRIALIDVLPEPRAFRYRLVGTAIYEIHEIELTGRYVTELRPLGYLRSVLNDLNELVETREPQLVRVEFENVHGRPRDFQVLRLPLASDGSTVDLIMALTDFGRAPLGMTG